MDLICTTCGEPWGMDHVIHECPEDFTRTHGVIEKCPACKYHKDNTPGGACVSKAKREIIAELGFLLGDDIDALATSIEDMGLDR